MEEFILVRHEAERRGLHWDLRLTIPNSENWASFAFNKFPPKEPSEKVYIVRTTDHSRQQALFTGKIPSGEYGAGKLIKEDSGKCEIIKYSNAHIVVDFKGKKLKGIYHFINTAIFGGRHNYKNKTYSFFKGKLKSED